MASDVAILEVEDLSKRKLVGSGDLEAVRVPDGEDEVEEEDDVKV